MGLVCFIMRALGNNDKMMDGLCYLLCDYWDILISVILILFYFYFFLFSGFALFVFCLFAFHYNQILSLSYFIVIIIISFLLFIFISFLFSLVFPLLSIYPLHYFFFLTPPIRTHTSPPSTHTNKIHGFLVLKVHPLVTFDDCLLNMMT